MRMLSIAVILLSISIILVNIQMYHHVKNHKPCQCEFTRIIKQAQDDRPGNFKDESRKFLLRKGN